MGTMLMSVTGMRLARFDVEREELVRGPDGRCVDCAPGEPGELLMPIKPNDPTTNFAGYSDAAATEKKIARNAFAPADAFFRTGDLLSRDARGYFRFVDRIGDTFRWKGENCSTTEVAEVLGAFPGLVDCNVYGVQIPNNADGRAPMAAVTRAQGGAEPDFKALVRHLRKNLPVYATPLFLRFQPMMDVTATLKHTKVQLREEGIDLARVQDPLYVLRGDTYERLTPGIMTEITRPFAKL